MASFLANLAREDLAPATLRGYRYDLRHFLACPYRAERQLLSIASPPHRSRRRARHDLSQ